MEWYNYLACFFAGALLANVVPHFVAGIQGNKFPTPFAKPPGKGLSSPTVNVCWALFNLIIFYLLLGPSHLQTGACVPLIVFFAGFAVLSIMTSISFSTKHKE